MTIGAGEEAPMLKFKVFSGGTITIDLDRCICCQSMTCLDVCREQGGPLRPDDDHGRPALCMSAAEIEKGGCVECLGCELECSLHGLGVIRIDLPLPGFEAYLDALTQPLVYRR